MLLEILVAIAAVPVVAVIGLLLVLVWRSSWKKTYTVPELSTNNVIIVSGCDSGFGRLTALSLLDLGFHVVATTFTEKGPAELLEASLGRLGELSVLHVDITDDDSVQSLADFVEDLLESAPEKNIFGLVNNAGIAVGGPIEVISFESFFKQIDVNLFGHIRMSQKLLPFIRRDAKTAGGRVINICSILGRVTTVTWLGPYCASKYAMESVTDSMRRELFPSGVAVTAVEPGVMNTHLLRSINPQQDFARIESDHKEYYQSFHDLVDQGMPRTLDNAGDPSAVSKAVVTALTVPKPKTRYLVGTDASIMAVAAWLLPDRLLDEFLVMM